MKNLYRGWQPPSVNHPLVWILSLYLLVVGSTLPVHDLWHDEVRTLQAIGADASALIDERAGAGHPPLFFLLQSAIADNSFPPEFSLRLLPLLFGTGSIATTYLLVARSFDQRISAWATLVFAFSPAQLLICQMGRSYTLLQLAVLLSMFVGLRYEGPRYYAWVTTMLCIAIAMYTHSSMLFWLPTLVASVLAARPKRGWWVEAVVFGSMAYLPFLAIHGEVSAPSHAAGNHCVNALQWFKFPARLALGRMAGDAPAGLTVAINLFLLTPLVLARLRGPGRWWHRALAVQCSLAALQSLLLAFVAENVIEVERYFAPIFPVSAFAAGWWLSQVRSALGSLHRAAAPGLVLCWCSIAMLTHIALPPFADDSRIAAYLFQHRRMVEPLVLFVRTSARSLSLLQYYPDFDVHIVEYDSAVPLPEFSQSIWVLIAEDKPHYRRRLLEKRGIQECVISQEICFRDARLLRFVKRPPTSLRKQADRFLAETTQVRKWGSRAGS